MATKNLLYKYEYTFYIFFIYFITHHLGYLLCSRFYCIFIGGLFGWSAWNTWNEGEGIYKEAGHDNIETYNQW